MFACLVILAHALSAGAEQTEPAVDEVLRNWEKATSTLKSMTAACSRTQVRAVFGTVEKHTGEVKLLRSGKRQGYLAELILRPEGKPQIFEKTIWAEDATYWFDVANKVIRVLPRPAAIKNPEPSANWIDRFVRAFSDPSFFGTFDLKAAQVKQRHEITYTSDRYYHYLTFKPRSNQDKMMFVELRVTLNRSTSLPRQIWLQQPGGAEITFDFTSLAVNPRLSAQDFGAPVPPAGWEIRK